MPNHGISHALKFMETIGIATDTPQAIRNNRSVKEAYLGTTLDEPAVEGAHA